MEGVRDARQRVWRGERECGGGEQERVAWSCTETERVRRVELHRDRESALQVKCGGFWVDEGEEE